VAFRHTVGFVVVAALISLAGVPAEAQQSPKNSALLERGRYLVEDASACGLCHTPRDANGRAVPGKALSGGRVMANDEYRAVVPNITVDPDTGLGRWSDLEIGTAIRDGRRPDGSLIGPPMPMELYRGFSDRDVAAMVLYLRTSPAVRNAVVERSTYPSALIPYGPPVTDVPDPPADDPVKRGSWARRQNGPTTWALPAILHGWLGSSGQPPPAITRGFGSFYA
jgi:mono/diheme cytochrome c family protein